METLAPTKDSSPPRGSALDEVLALSAAAPPAADGSHLLAPLLLASTAPEALAGYSAEQLLAFAERARSTLSKRTPGAERIEIASDGAKGTLIEILNDDMPFLLASISGEIQSRGTAIDLVLHPLLKVERGSDGGLVRIAGPGDSKWSDGLQESYILIRLANTRPEALGDLKAGLAAVLADVRAAVRDWRAMIERLQQAIGDLEQAPAQIAEDERSEAIAFARWLAAGSMTLLGMREYRFLDQDGEADLRPVAGSGLGLLRDPTRHVLRRGAELVAITPEVVSFLREPSPLIITKANVKSRVHRRVHMDYVGIKRYEADGRLAGELRLVGLFTAQAYTSSPLAIPVLRRKAGHVIATSGHPPESHAGRALLNVLETFPRDELFQIGAEQLAEWCRGIVDLDLRPRVRVFARIDRFDRFVSVLTYLPRERYTTRARERIGDLLSEAYRGTISAFYPRFADGPLVRVQFIVRRVEGATPAVSSDELERQIGEILSTWEDKLAAAIAEVATTATGLAERYAGAFPAGYSETFPPARALEDIERLERLSASRPLSIDFHTEPGDGKNRIRAAIYRLDQPIRLSERVPVLENLGFAVIDERSFPVTPLIDGRRRRVILHDMQLETLDGAPLDLVRHDLRLEDAFRAVLDGAAESDRFNRLVIAADADWREAALMRAIAAYLRQLASPFGPGYIADTLVRHAGIARNILELFHVRLDPDRPGSTEVRAAAAEAARARIETALDSVSSLDEDRILRQVTAVVIAVRRTSYYKRDRGGQPLPTIALKLEMAALDIAPKPRPYREIWVHGPRVEGVHLRFAPIARGGLRWSDRAQDFRTEVLGLVKAQQVKNAVIVPAGAKGGFYPKQLPRSGTREAVQSEGVAAYTAFVSALLDVTDNIVDDAIQPPDRVVRLDGDDPYLVVAADKGTATFSDTANAIATGRGFWLADAFASGGSIGYDHKRMGITARGAWECVKRHFREIDVDIQTTPFRVIGVGDMSGDVFGNGMLLSPAIKLVAAFDHRDIFLDPTPDPARSMAERQRLFALPRSSWQDYDRSLISPGGGVHSRSAKSIPISAEVQAMIGTDATSLTPAELMRALLKADCDLLWFGGIGTYIRSSTESDTQVGDRANDTIRVTGSEVRARVIGEGANLGITQRGRIELATRGIRLNTDFIDNSAGVNTSDQEVNIKIALGPIVRSGRLAEEDRRTLLAEMTGDVARAVLRNNYQQSLALSLAELASAREIDAWAALIETLEGRGLLERGLEALPDPSALIERRQAARGLTRPELAVLLSYGKIALLEDLIASPVPDAAEFEPLAIRYFPPALSERFADDLRRHRLRREIIATTLTNEIVNRLGAATPFRLAADTGRPASEVAYAFTAARTILGLDRLWDGLDALDGKIPGQLQLGLYASAERSLVPLVARLLREGAAARDLHDTIVQHGSSAKVLASLAEEQTGPSARTVHASWLEAGVPGDIVASLRSLAMMAEAPAVSAVARAAAVLPEAAARMVLALNGRLRIADLIDPVRRSAPGDAFDTTAAANATETILEARDALACRLLAGVPAGGQEPAAAEEQLKRAGGERFATLERTLAEIAAGALTPGRLMVAASRLADFARSVKPENAARGTPGMAAPLLRH